MFHLGNISSWGRLLPHGALTVILPGFEPGAVNAAIRNHALTTIGAVPTMLAFMIQHPHYRPEMLSSRQLIMCGAAPMPPGLLDTWMTTYPHLDFLQPNGMTEGAATGSRTAG